jgi:hypothetical protein
MIAFSVVLGTSLGLVVLGRALALPPPAAAPGEHAEREAAG